VKLVVTPSVAALSMSAALTLCASPAWGFVRSVTAPGCVPVHWAPESVSITSDSAGVADMPLADVERIARAAIAGWQGRTCPQSALELSYASATGPHEVGNDGIQVIKFRSETWCRPPAQPGEEPICYDPSASALTTLTYMTSDGRIIDADIELNAVDNQFYDADSQPPPAGRRRPLDLWNTLAHELGHLQGLDHTCRSGPADGMPACARDDQGDEVVQCHAVEQGQAHDAALAAIFMTTMYPTTAAGEIHKRAPKEDDIRGIDAIYPRGSTSSGEAQRVCGAPADAGTATDEAPLDVSSDATSAGYRCSISQGRIPWEPRAGLGAFAITVACVARRGTRRRARRAPTSPRPMTTCRAEPSTRSRPLP
jgi:hypothetical protein